MPVQDYQINDKKSFVEVTKSPREVAGLYFYYVLDYLVDLANKVSHEFFKSPHLFTDLGSSGIASVLARLYAEYGTHSEVLSSYQRKVIYSAVFGKPEGYPTGADDLFHQLKINLLGACAMFVETKFGDEASLRINVRQKHVLFKQFLTGVQGASVTCSSGGLSILTEKISYPILRDSGVAAVFTSARAPVSNWPYVHDVNGNKLAAEIYKRLIWPGKAQEEDTAEEPYGLTPNDLACRQECGLRGAESIATAIDVDATSTDAEVDMLITKCYTWYTALQSLKDYPEAYPDTGEPRSVEKRRGIALAQPMPSAANRSTINATERAALATERNRNR